MKQGNLILDKSGGTIFTNDLVRDINSYVKIEDAGKTNPNNVNAQLDIGQSQANSEWARFITGGDALRRLDAYIARSHTV